jgi:hypothetical protein
MRIWNKHGCGTCEKTFTSISNLFRHQRKANSHSGRRYVCKECGKWSKTEVEFDLHQLSLHDRHKYGCVFCKKTFTTIGNLSRHHRHSHSGHNWNPWSTTHNDIRKTTTPPTDPKPEPKSILRDYSMSDDNISDDGEEKKQHQLSKNVIRYFFHSLTYNLAMGG